VFNAYIVILLLLQDLGFEKPSWLPDFGGKKEEEEETKDETAEEAKAEEAEPAKEE